MKKEYKILVVCSANKGRSASYHAHMKHFLKEKKIDHIKIDSAGINFPVIEELYKIKDLGADPIVKDIMNKQGIYEINEHKVKAINQKFPLFLIPKNIKHFMTINIADVSVKAYHLQLPEKFLQSNQLSSFKLKNLNLIDITDLTSLKPLQKGIRPGVVEIAQQFSLNTNLNPSINCQLNQQLAYIFS